MGAPLCLPQWSQICQTECYPCDRIEALPMCPVGQLMICNINIAGTLGLGIALAFIQRPRVIYAVTGAWIAIGWVYFRAISFVM